MDNEMVYKMFVNSLLKMSDDELNNALKKAKEMLSEKDYNTLVSMIEKEKGNSI